ncbi:MAG: phosphate signaling complex protein PhoU [Cellulosilyticaceae bacterium]
MAARIVFESELENLRNEVIHMGEALEKTISKTIKAIVEQEHVLAKEVMENDDFFDLLEVELEKKCISIILHQQPMARDLRLIMSILKTVTDMERIADQCEDICRYTLKIKDGEWSNDVNYKRHIERMATNILEMLKKTLDSFIQKDVAKLHSICMYDDEVDAAFKKIWHELVEEMNKSSEFAKNGAQYIMVIKYFERIADHITNIAEWFIYNITGEYVKDTIHSIETK